MHKRMPLTAEENKSNNSNDDVVDLQAEQVGQVRVPCKFYHDDDYIIEVTTPLGQMKQNEECTRGQLTGRREQPNVSYHACKHGIQSKSVR